MKKGRTVCLHTVPCYSESVCVCVHALGCATIHFRLTDGASPVAGVAEGTSITTSLDGLMSLSLAKITIHHRGHRGSVSVLGGTHNTRPSDHPVVGGTGDFAYALGYVRSSPVDLRGSTVTYKMELQLYWPPYAPYAPTPQ